MSNGNISTPNDMDVSSELSVDINELNSNHSLYAKVQELGGFYRSQFGAEANFFVRVPGRVNIIGEHVDYCGYPVFPMALNQCVILAVGYTDENQFLQLRNIETDKYENYKCDLKTMKIELPQCVAPAWYNYYLCGVKGVYETLGDNIQHLGMNIALGGNIPPASGLSSSSALISASVLATAHVHGLYLDRKQLASISARCERYIGTEGGGMDQAIAYLGKVGCAEFIEFHPELNATSIALPAGACFVVANCLSEKNKAASSDFNERVVECRLGARMLAKFSGLANWRTITQFVQLQQELKCNLEQLEELTKKHLTQDIYKRDEICAILNVTEDELEGEFLTPNTRQMLTFKLRQRSLHVIQESLRVLKFREICEQSSNGTNHQHLNGFNGGDSSDVIATNAERLQTLSKLLRQSHRSLKELYECSHTDLDQLVAISDEMGIGARLTGAGWGGCIVALCDSLDASAKYIRLLKDRYFGQLPTHILERHLHNDFADVVFATFPCNGAEIFSAVSKPNH